MQMRTFKNSAGFTLIEILIALALGVLLSSALVQIFGSSKQLASMENALSRMQETGRFALDALAKDVRMAGYQGCADPNDLDLTVIAKQFDDGKFNGNAVIGYEVASDGAFSPTPGADDLVRTVQKTSATGTVFARPGTDVISILFAETEEAELAQGTDVSSNVKLTDNPAGLTQGDFAIVSDCKSAHLFEISNVLTGGGASSEVTFTHASNENTTNKLVPGYQSGAHLMSFENRTYFVADSGRDTPAGEDIYSLYVKEFADSPQEILEGVENLQILYGQQLGSGQLRYVTADDLNLDWGEVVSVRIGVLVQSFSQVADSNDTRTYVLPGASISNSGIGAHAGDRALRKPFTATVKLRNRRQEI